MNVSGIMPFTESGTQPGTYTATTTDPLASSLTTYSVNILQGSTEFASYFTDSKETVGNYLVQDAPTPLMLSQDIPVPTIENIVYVTIPPATAPLLAVPSIIPCLRGDTLNVTLPLMGTLTGWAKIIFTAKQFATDTDAQAMFQVEALSGGGGGLIILAGAPAPDATQGALAVVNATTGAVTLTLAAVITATFPPQSWYWDCEVIFTTGGIVSTPINGRFNNLIDITQQTS